jgi:mannosylfructose-phosphate synthase
MGKGEKKKKKSEEHANSAPDRIMMISTHGYVAADPPLGAPDTGGQVVYVLEVARKLGQFGYKVDIWTRQFEDQPKTEEVDDNVQIIRMPCGGKDFIPKEYLYEKLPEWVTNAKKYIKKNGITYAFINSHYWDAGVAGEMLSDQLDIVHIHTPHSIGSWKKEQMLTDYPDSADEFEHKYNFSERIKHETQIYRSVALIVATTPIQVDKIQEDYDIPEKRIRMIPPGYDDNRFFPVGEPTRQAVRAQYGFSGKTVFAVSRLANNKGLDLLVDSFKIVADRMEDARLVLAIGHEDRSESEEEIYQNLISLTKKHGIEDRVSFIGFIPDEELPDYYRSADLFVLSSRYEPFGITAIEAMASGTPTVVTIHGGLARVLEYGIHAVFADTFDREELGITIVKALRYKSLHRRMSERGAQLVRARFTWTGIAQEILNAVENRTDALESLHVKPKEHL